MTRMGTSAVKYGLTKTMWRGRAPRLPHRFHAVQSEIHLRCRIIGDFAAGEIAARHTGYEKTVGEHSGRSWFVRLVAWG